MSILKEEKVDWNCVCITLEDWNDFTSKYKKSRKKQDQELYRILEENYLNEMPALFPKAVYFSFFSCQQHYLNFIILRKKNDSKDYWH